MLDHRCKQPTDKPANDLRQSAQSPPASRQERAQTPSVLQNQLLRMTRLKQCFGTLLMSLALAIGLTASAAAQSVRYEDDSRYRQDKQWRWFIGAGVTLGGEKLAIATFDNGYDRSIRAGSFFQLYGGIEYRIHRQFQLALSAGYHTDSTSTRFGSVQFDRYPVELLAYYQPLPHWRFGGGVRVALSPRLYGDGDAASLSESFETAISPVLEAEYFFTPFQTAKFRVVRERYDSKDGLPTARGDHFGLLFNLYF